MFLPGNEHDVGNSRMLQCLKRIKDHRLIIDRQKMLIRDKCERMQARPQSSGQNDAFHIRSLYPTALLCVNAGFDVGVKDPGFFSYVANPLWVCDIRKKTGVDRKRTLLNSSHQIISHAVFSSKKKL